MKEITTDVTRHIEAKNLTRHEDNKNEKPSKNIPVTIVTILVPT